MAVISGHVGQNTANIVVTYNHVNSSIRSVQSFSDASGNHTSIALQPGVYVVTARALGLVFSSVSVTIDGANPQDQIVNLRSRAVNASNTSAI